MRDSVKDKSVHDSIINVIRNEALKPCPCCGRIPEIKQYKSFFDNTTIVIHCKYYACNLPYYIHSFTVIEAVTAWNSLADKWKGENI